MKPECRQQDEGGYWVCIVLDGWWDQKLRVDVEEKFIESMDSWVIEETRICTVCGEYEISYPL